MRFLELGERGRMSEDCRSGKFMESEEHTCGLGTGVSCLWAHDTVRPWSSSFKEVLCVRREFGELGTLFPDSPRPSRKIPSIA